MQKHWSEIQADAEAATGAPINPVCTLNPVHDEDVHMNMAKGTWPVAVLGQYTGELVITNVRSCLCGNDDGLQVFYQD